MKKMKIAGLVLLSLIIVTKSFGQSGSTEQLTVPLSSPGKPYSLKVHLVSGSIKVASYEGKDVIINVIPRDGDKEDESNAVENGMKRISTHGSYEVTAKEADNNVTVNTGNPNKAIDLDLKIPQDVKLQIGTVNDGEVTVENVRGELEVNNVNDKITLTNISGSVVANTVNGDVNVTFKTVDPKAPMSFSTLNGDVNVTLPADTKANLKLKSDNGDVFSDFDIEIDKTPAKIDKTTEPGLYKIKKDDWVSGKINGGGPEMMMKNMQGNIYVKKGAK
jgi:Putative adhesin